MWGIERSDAGFAAICERYGGVPIVAITLYRYDGSTHRGHIDGASNGG
ncbi:hypothetical protein [Homoserinimonas hongtaonis]|nr:hypothetical protein [Salinibacterium hongtaonis]